MSPPGGYTLGGYHTGRYSPGGYSPGGYPLGGYPPGGATPGGHSPRGYPPGVYPPRGDSPGGFSPGGFSPGGCPPGVFSPGGYPPGRYLLEGILVEATLLEGTLQGPVEFGVAQVRPIVGIVLQPVAQISRVPLVSKESVLLGVPALRVGSFGHCVECAETRHDHGAFAHRFAAWCANRPYESLAASGASCVVRSQLQSRLLELA